MFQLSEFLKFSKYLNLVSNKKKLLDFYNLLQMKTRL